MNFQQTNLNFLISFITICNNTNMHQLNHKRKTKQKTHNANHENGLIIPQKLIFVHQILTMQYFYLKISPLWIKCFDINIDVDDSEVLKDNFSVALVTAIR